MLTKPVISYGITVCNEIKEFRELLQNLNEVLHDNSASEIVILCDSKNGDLNGIIDAYRDFIKTKHEFVEVRLISKHFEGDFAKHKNFLNDNCKGEWILQIDADEILPKELIVDLMALATNPEEDLGIVGIPRVNIVNGLTQEWIDKWRWSVANGMVNFPDYQFRFYRNDIDIQWVGKVHERVMSNEFSTSLMEPRTDIAIKHVKDLARQIKQNELYEKLGQ